MKRFFAFLLCGILTAGTFAACGKTETPPGGTVDNFASSSVSDSGTEGTGVSSAVDTDSDGSPASSGKEEIKLDLFDPTLDRKVIMDDSAKGILVMDLSLCGDTPDGWLNLENAVIWEWTTDDAEGAKMEGKTFNIDSARYRYSPYYETDVIVFCGSGGWVGVIDYETKEVLFEDNPGYGPHSAELMPNGDLVLACSGNSDSENGRIMYYPLSSGSEECSSYLLLESAHGVCWDPANQIIWGLGGYEICGYRVSDAGTEGAKLSVIGGMGASLRDQGASGGHEMVPAFGDPGKYWVSSGKDIWLFDGSEGTLSKSPKYTGTDVKGMAYFSDGTMIVTAHDQGGTGTYRSSELRVLYLAESSGKVKKAVIKEVVIPHRGDSQTYKINVFTKDYQ